MYAYHVQSDRVIETTNTLRTAVKLQDVKYWKVVSIIETRMHASFQIFK